MKRAITANALATALMTGALFQLGGVALSAPSRAMTGSYGHTDSTAAKAKAEAKRERRRQKRLREQGRGA